MFQIHGWATLQESADGTDSGKMEQIVSRIKDEIAAAGWNTGLLHLQAMNGTYYMNTSSFTNRKSQEAEDIVKLFEYIGKAAPGSYGLLYSRDDEDQEGRDNEFRVLVLTRGSLKEQKDPFLSPCMPIIEDEFDGD